MNDVFCKILQIQKLFPLLLQLASFVTQRLRQHARQIRNRQEAKQIADEPNSQSFARGCANGSTRNFPALASSIIPPRKNIQAAAVTYVMRLENKMLATMMMRR